MKIKRLNEGYKGEGDNPITIQTRGQEKISNLDIFKIINMIMDNEEKIYPRPKFAGNQHFKQAIIKILDGHDPEKVDSKFKASHWRNINFLKDEEWSKVYCNNCHNDIECSNCKRDVWILKNQIKSKGEDN